MRTLDVSSDQVRWIYVLGAVAGIVGAFAGMVGNLAHPVTPIGDPEGVARAIAGSEGWVAIHLVIVFGIVLMLGGLIALHQSISGGLAGALSRLGLYAAIVGIGIGLVLVILDGVAAPQLAEEWAAAPAGEKAIALRILLANETTNFALASLFNIVFAGVTFILFGLAVAFASVYPRWLGGIAVAAGVGSVAAGLLQAVAGEPTQLARILTIIGPTVITLWTVLIGVLLLGKLVRVNAERQRVAH